MAFQVVITPLAQVDLRDARRWYDRQRAGLGREFLAAAKSQLAALQQHPERHACVLGEVRKLQLKRFPYTLFYRLREDRVVVVACLHHRRDPQALQRRP